MTNIWDLSYGLLFVKSKCKNLFKLSIILNIPKKRKVWSCCIMRKLLNRANKSFKQDNDICMHYIIIYMCVYVSWYINNPWYITEFSFKNFELSQKFEIFKIYGFLTTNVYYEKYIILINIKTHQLQESDTKKGHFLYIRELNPCQLHWPITEFINGITVISWELPVYAYILTIHIVL